MNRRGIALITVLFMVLLITMMVTAAVKTAPGNLAAANSYGDRQYALMAAEAGVNYARARLKENLNWRGSADSGPVEVVRTPDDSLVVIEDHGNVIGLMRLGPGEFAQFQMRFNHQDGAGNDDGLDDPDPAFGMALPYISANNLTSASALGKFRDTGSGATDTGLDVPGLQAYVAVEGLAGPGLRDADPQNPTALQGRGLSRVVVEAHLQAGFGGSLDAAAMAAGNIQTYISPEDPGEVDPTRSPRDPRLELESAVWGSDRIPPKARAKGTFGVTSARSGANLYSRDGSVDTQSSSLEAGTIANSELTVGYETDGAGFYQLGWSDIHHADSAPNSSDAVNLKAGTYVVFDDLSVHYYDMSYDDYAAHILGAGGPGTGNPEDPGTPLNDNLEQARNNFGQVGGDAIELHHTTTVGSNLEAQLLIHRDVFVEPTANTSDFTFITRRGPIEGRPQSDGTVPGELYPSAGLHSTKVQFQFVPRGGEQATVSCPGKVTIGCRVWGDGGAITAEDDIKIVGAGALSAVAVDEGGDGLSLYTKGNIDLNGYKYGSDNNSGRFGDLAFRGVLYAWGDIKVKFSSDPGEADTDFYNHFGRFTCRGAMVAYGGDPSGAPGSGGGSSNAGNGNIEIQASWSKLVYDPSYIGSLDQTALPDRMNVISWNVRE